MFKETSRTSKVAVVGNGPSIKSFSGEEIDAHDVVIRFNNFKTKGYEEHTGSKTTIWACTFNSDIANRTTDNIKHIACVLPLLDERFIRRHSALDPVLMHRYTYLVALIQSFCNVSIMPFDLYERAGRLSAGMLMLYWLYVERGWSLDGVTIAGFSFFDPEDNHHYWPCDENKRGSHNGDVEKEFLRKMIHKEIR